MKCLWLLLLAFGIAHAEMLTGYVVGISDGDTITVLDTHRLPSKPQESYSLSIIVFLIDLHGYTSITRRIAYCGPC